MKPSRPLLFVTAFGLQVSSLFGQSKAALTALDQFSESVQAMSARVAPSVVQIQSTHYSPREESVGGRVTLVVGKEQSIGSGVITSADGYILTNAHVVAGAERIRVTLVRAPGKGDSSDTLITGALSEPFAHSLEAKLVGVFQEMDLALIKISATGLPVIPFADYSKLRQGRGRLCSLSAVSRPWQFDEHGSGEQHCAAAGSR